jgi:hypothetical protein
MERSIGLLILSIGVLLALGCSDSGSGFNPGDNDAGVPDGDTDSDSDSDSSTDSDSGGDTESDTDTETEDTDSDSETESASETGEDTDTESDSDSSTESDTETETEVDTDTGPAPPCSGPGVYLGDWAPTEGRCWEKVPPNTYQTYSEAVARCEALVLDGHDDWRLPNINELRYLIEGCPTAGCSLYDPSCLYEWCTDTCVTCPLLAGPAPGGCYWRDGLGGECSSSWSSSLRLGEPGTAHWTVGFKSAVTNASNSISLSRCVRPVAL